MALLSGFDRIEASNNTFSDWLNKTNEMIDLFRDNTVTANSSGANTDGNARLNGEFVANTIIAYDDLRGGDLSVGLGTGSANLNIVSNTIFTTAADIVIIEANLQVDTDSLFLGNVQAQSTVQFANNDSAVEFKGANQDFIWLSTNTHATIRTSSIGSLELNADVSANGDNESSIQLKVDSVNVAAFAEGGNIAFYSADGTTEKIKWDAANQVLGVNTASPQTDIALDVAGNTHTTDLNVTNQTTSGNVVVNDELRGNTTLTVTTNAQFTDAQVVVDNDLFVLSDARVTSNLTVNTDSTFVGDIEVQTDSLLIGNVEAQSTIEFTKGSSTLEFAGANQDFIWDASNTHSTIRTNANGSLIIDADKTNDGANTSHIDLRVDNKNSVRIEDDHVAFYNQAGTAKRLYWDSTNLGLGINVASVTAGLALQVSGNTQTTDLNVANQTTSGNVVVNDELRGNNTLTVTTNAQFTDAQVVVDNDLFVLGDAQVTSNLTVNTDSTFVGNIEVQTDSLFIGNVEAQSTIEFTKGESTLEFAGANQDFIWDATNTRSTIRTNANGSLIVDADKTNDGANTSRIDLRVDNKNSVRIEDDHVAFYNEAGTSKRLYWDATNLGLGVNVASVGAGLALQVSGNTQTTDLVVTNAITANVVTIQNSLTGSANLAIVSNTDFSSNVTMADDLTVDGTLTITDLDYTLVPDDYNDLIPNQTSGRLLGNTTNRWDGYFTDLDVSNDLDVGGNVTVTDTITTDTLVVTNSAALPSAISFTGVTDFEDINVTGVASFANLEVQNLTTNSAALIGTGGVVTSTTPTKIDEFDKTVSRGFKYIIHGENDDSDSAYAIEINCSHNGTDVYYTRFGEVSNNFDAVIVPQVNGGNIELIATCSSASVSNTHSFNMVRIETR